MRQGGTHNDRYLPDKAIDLLDEAGSCRRLARAREEASTSVHKLQQQLKRLNQEKAVDLQNHNFGGGGTPCALAMCP